jgi:trans-aconitate methyltransferase
LSPEPPLYKNRQRALSFGGIATQYDRARPAYPPALVDRLMEWSPRHVLDVGCGTGRASRLLVARGCDVLGVEPDASMAAVAQSHGVTVEPGTFEEWDPRQRMFDLVMSGQAWHWVQPEAGAAKAASVLRPGGHLAVFWNRGRHDPETGAALDAVYARLAPSIAQKSTELRPSMEVPAERIGTLQNSGPFSDVETDEFTWETVYDRAAWLDLIATHSDHVTLPAATQAELLDAIGDVIDRRGGSIPYSYSTLLVVAARRP